MSWWGSLEVKDFLCVGFSWHLAVWIACFRGFSWLLLSVVWIVEFIRSSTGLEGFATVFERFLIKNVALWDGYHVCVFLRGPLGVHQGTVEVVTHTLRKETLSGPWQPASYERLNARWHGCNVKLCILQTPRPIDPGPQEVWFGTKCWSSCCRPCRLCLQVVPVLKASLQYLSDAFAVLTQLVLQKEWRLERLS